MANIIVLLQVVILYLHCNFAKVSTSPGEHNNNVPTTEFTPTQFHIQTDDGANRFFKYQTWSGQFRKETRLDDGSVAGSYGWVDANGMLRVYEYKADKDGYRITHSAMYNVGKQDGKKLSKKNDIRLSNKINTKVNRKKSPFFRTSQQRKNAQLRRQEQKEDELSNDIFGNEDILEVLPTPITSPQPVVLSLKRRRTTQPLRQLNRPNMLQFIKRPNTQRETNLKKNAFLQLEREQNEIFGQASSSRLQRRISTPDGQIRTVNVEPLFDDEDFSSIEEGKPIQKSNTPIDHGDDILISPSQEQPNGRVILNTPYRRRTNLDLLRKERVKGGQRGSRLRFNSFRNRQQRKLRRRPGTFSNGGPFVIKRRRRPVNREGRIPMTREKDSILQGTNDNGQVGRLSVNYETSNTFHHENTFKDGQRKGQYGYIDPIGVRRVVTYTTGSRASSAKGKSAGGITKIKENDFYGTNTYFKAN